MPKPYITVATVHQVCQLCPKCDKSGTFSNQISIHFGVGRRAPKCIEIWYEKVPFLSNLIQFFAKSSILECRWYIIHQEEGIRYCPVARKSFLLCPTQRGRLSRTNTFNCPVSLVISMSLSFSIQTNLLPAPSPWWPFHSNPWLARGQVPTVVSRRSLLISPHWRGQSDLPSLERTDWPTVLTFLLTYWLDLLAEKDVCCFTCQHYHNSY